ncbi:MAG: hypothetical protein HYY05_06905 [Chloroflexi bacterium]|nr:hypothetical protein [Chloroflexota bacterium]
MKRKLILVAAILGGSTLLLPLGLTPPPLASAAIPVDARIQIVWPHDELGRPAPVESAPLVNVEVFLFEPGTLNPMVCNFPNQVRLRWAQNGQMPQLGGAERAFLAPTHDRVPGQVVPDVAIGQRIMRNVDGKEFPLWIFNDVPVARVPGGQITTYFLVEVEGADFKTSVWAHSADPRTFLPDELIATGKGSATPTVADAMIQIVWPHDFRGELQPVAAAPLANLAVDLFEHPMSVDRRAPNKSVDMGFDREVRLLRALNHGYLERVMPANHRTTRTVGDLSWPRWEFNDVDVSAAADPFNKYYFAIEVDGVPTHTTIWSHGADARTIFPQRDVVARSCTTM